MQNSNQKSDLRIYDVFQLLIDDQKAASSNNLHPVNDLLRANLKTHALLIDSIKKEKKIDGK